MADENKYNIKIECGTDFVLPFVWTDDNGNPKDLTGAVVTAQLRESPSSPDAYDFICTHNNTGGRIMLIMPNEVTKQIAFPYGVYDVSVVLGTDVLHPLYGEVKVQDNVTKPLDGEMLYTIAIESYDKLPVQGLTNRLYYLYAEQMILRWNGTNYVSAFEFFELHNEGAWNEDTAYQKYATVTNAGSSYMALKNVPEGIDIHNTTYWLMLAEAGGAENIDDEAGEGDTTVTWSADKGWKEHNKATYLYCPHLSDTTIMGDMNLFVFPNGKVLCIDAGYTDQEDAIDAYLASKNITHIDCLIITHFHGDHCGCFEHVADNYCDETTIFYRGIDWDTTIISESSANRQAYIDYMAEHGYTAIIPTNNSTVQLWDDCKIKFLNTSTSYLADYYTSHSDTTAEDHLYPSINNMSLICVIETLGKKILCCGDIERPAQIKNASNIPEVDILKVPHHNWNMNGHFKFFDNANPKVAYYNRNINTINLLDYSPHYWDKYLLHTGKKINSYQTRTTHVEFRIRRDGIDKLSGNLQNFAIDGGMTNRRLMTYLPYYKEDEIDAWDYATWTIDDVLTMTKQLDKPCIFNLRSDGGNVYTEFISELSTVLGSIRTSNEMIVDHCRFTIIPSFGLQSKTTTSFEFVLGFKYADAESTRKSYYCKRPYHQLDIIPDDITVTNTHTVIGGLKVIKAGNVASVYGDIELTSNVSADSAIISNLPKPLLKTVYFGIYNYSDDTYSAGRLLEHSNVVSLEPKVSIASGTQIAFGFTYLCE